MRRYPSRRDLSYAFGPGPLSQAVKALILMNVAVFVVTYLNLVPAVDLVRYFGLSPIDVLKEYKVWQFVTYMFLHGTFGHILFNMLALWMFGTELERSWGTGFFLKYYFATGLTAALATVLLAITPFGFGYLDRTIGASGAIYGLLVAYGLAYPDRPIYMYLVFPIPAKYFVMIMGGIALISSMGEPLGGIAHVAHLGGLVGGYFILRGRYLRSGADIKYWYLRWKMTRLKRKFGVHSGGRTDDWNRRIH